MSNRIITSEWELSQWVTFLRGRKLPLTVTAVQGKHRTNEQNRLQRKWISEVAEQRGDISPEEVRGYGKLHFGVPILRNEDEQFAEVYDRVIRPLPYEAKLALMQVPIDLPVTSRMTTGQKTRFLDAVYQHWTAQGLVLTQPEQVAA